MKPVLVFLGIALTSTIVIATEIHVQLHLHPASETALESKFWEVSTPTSRSFRKFLSFDEMCQLAAPSDSTASLVLAYLRRNYPSSRIELSRCGDFVNLYVPDEESLGELWVSDFQLSLTKRRRGHLERRSMLTIPSNIRGFVDAIFVFDPTPVQRGRRLKGQFPGMDQDPFTISARYHIPSWVATGSASTNLSQAVAEFEQEQFYHSNIVAFNKQFNASAPNVSVQGPNNGGYFGEGNLDLEYINVLAGDQAEITTWWVAKNEFDLSSWADLLMTITPLPLVASISWGSGESGFAGLGMKADNAAFKKLGVLGVSVMAASGDQGTSSTGFFSCGKFDPTWPASSPYVTAVGGTYSNSAQGHEISWGSSGGGFSAYFTAPSYQNASIAGYFNNASANLPAQKYWTRNGRGTPDVSALATNFKVYSGGWGRETGTSAATPTFSAMISRIVQARLAAGKTSLGFLNPTLYESGPGSFGYDVVEGDNKVSSCPSGFSAIKGWDAISGLGTPNFEELRKLLF